MKNTKMKKKTRKVLIIESTIPQRYMSLGLSGEEMSRYATVKSIKWIKVKDN